MRISKYLEVLPDTNELQYNGGHYPEIHKVEPKSMQVLLHLLKKRGELCSNEELVMSVWEGNERVGGPALRRTVYKLRSQFSKLGNEDVIQTVPKKGYLIKNPKRHFPLIWNRGFWILILTGLLVFAVLKVVYPGMLHRLLH